MRGALSRLLTEAIAEISAAEGTIWVLSPSHDQLDAALNVGLARAVVETMSVPINASVIGMVASTGLSTCIGPDDWHNPDVDRATGIPTRAMAAAPLRYHDDMVGVVSVINPPGGQQRFSGSDLEILQWKTLLMGLVLESGAADAGPAA